MANPVALEKPEVTGFSLQVIGQNFGNGSYSGREHKITLMARVENSVTWNSNNKPPHFTVDLRPGTTSFQHIAMRFPAYQLGVGHGFGGYDSNSGVGRNVQVCILGVNDSTQKWWTDDRIDRLGKMLYDICAMSGGGFKIPYPFSATASKADGARLDPNVYLIANGILGIQHDPNSPGRWGPGDMPEEKVLGAINKYAALAAEKMGENPQAPPGSPSNPSPSSPESETASGEDKKKDEYKEKDMSDKEFRFNPPLHKLLMPDRVDFSSWDPAGFMDATWKDESTFQFGSKDSAPLQKLRLGRIIQHERSAGLAATNARRIGFRFLYNPTQFTTSATRNDSIVINPQSTIGAVLSGINQNFQTVGFKVFLNRTADVLSRKTPTKGDYPYEIYGDDISMIRQYGTHWDLERLYRLCNGVFNMSDRGQSADIGVLIPANARLLLGQQNHFGFVESVAWTDQMFSENMVPVLTEVEIVFRRHVDMQPAQMKEFWDRIGASGISGEDQGGGEDTSDSDTDKSGGSYDPNGVKSGGGMDPMALWKKNGLNAGWSYSTNDPNKKIGSDGHRAWDIQARWEPLLSGVYGTVGDLNDGVPDNKVANYKTGAPSNWIAIHTTYKGQWATVYYQHLKKDSISVAVGTKVTPHTRIGTTGFSGHATGPHLHLATWHGKRTDANRYPKQDDQIIYPPSAVFSQ